MNLPRAYLRACSRAASKTVSAGSRYAAILGLAALSLPNGLERLRPRKSNTMMPCHVSFACFSSLKRQSFCVANKNVLDLATNCVLSVSHIPCNLRGSPHTGTPCSHNLTWPWRPHLSGHQERHITSAGTVILGGLWLPREMLFLVSDHTRSLPASEPRKCPSTSIRLPS